LFVFLPPHSYSSSLSLSSTSSKRKWFIVKFIHSFFFSIFQVYFLFFFHFGTLEQFICEWTKRMALSCMLVLLLYFIFSMILQFCIHKIIKAHDSAASFHMKCVKHYNKCFEGQCQSNIIFCRYCCLYASSFEHKIYYIERNRVNEWSAVTFIYLFFLLIYYLIYQLYFCHSWKVLIITNDFFLPSAERVNHVKI
jgi:hypothetical protein